MIHVALAADKNIFRHAVPVIRSAMARSSRPVRFHFVTRGVDEATFAELRERTGSDMIQYKADEVVHKGDLKLGAWITVSTMDRLRFPSILPQTVSKLIYLDIDTVVMADLAEMFDLPTGDCGLAAKLSTRRAFWMGSDYAKRARVDIDHLRRLAGGDWRNFNAGVLLMDLDKFRANDYESITARLVEATGCNDQIALVMYSMGRHAILPARWNTWVTVDHELPHVKPYGVLHYVGSKKPWAHPDKILAGEWSKWVIL